MRRWLPLLTFALAGPAVAGPYEDGYAAGAAEARHDDVRGAAIGGFLGGFALAGAGVVAVGVAGVPAIGVGMAAPGVVGWLKPISPPVGPWMEQPRAYQAGYVEGYGLVARRQRTKAAIAMGAVGAGLGTAAAVTTLVVVGDATGRVNVF
ncbi:MAG: hypothetical protein H6739_21415 [Alphaproteobacteria bacterium]|nr:hypothetical protein [Alphaproteobacteria bacterium]